MSQCGHFRIIFEEFGMLESYHFKKASQFSTKVDLEGDDVKGILDARVFGISCVSWFVRS